MLGAAIILVSINSYKAIKRHVVNIDRPHKVNGYDRLYLRSFVGIGQLLYLLGQYFLLTAPTSLLVSNDFILAISLTAFVLADIQDIVFLKNPNLLYYFDLGEFLTWANLTLIAFMSARWGEGVLLFIASFSRLADIFLLYLNLSGEGMDLNETTINKKRN